MALFVLPRRNLLHSAGKQSCLSTGAVPRSLPEAAAYNKAWDGSGHLLSCTWGNELKLCIKIIRNYCLSTTCFQGCRPWVHFPSSSHSRSVEPGWKACPSHYSSDSNFAPFSSLFLCKFKMLTAVFCCLHVWMELFWLSLTHPLFLHCLQSPPSVFPLKALWRMDFVLCEETNASKAL